MVPVSPRMRSFSPPALAARHGIHYGWVLVAVTFLLVLVGAGVRSAPGVLIKPLEQDFGWSRAQVSYALSVSLLTLGLAGPASGWLMNRFGIRGTTIGFLVLGAAGVALTVVMQALWQLHLFWGLLVGFGTGGMSLVLSAAIANTWFEQRRGLVTGLLGGAASAGQFVFLQVLLGLEEAFGWRAAVGFLALLLGGLVLPLVVLLIRNTPAELGLQPYGARPGRTLAAADDRVTPMSAAVRTGDFWLLALSFAICGFTTIGLIGTHFIPHATEHGFSDAEAAGILSLIGALNIVGTIGSGYLTDRYSPRRLLAVYYALRAGSLLALPAISSLPMMSAFAIVFGLDYIATVPPTVMLTAERFGRRSVPTIYGWITCAHMVGGAAAAALAGQIHDVAGDYAIAIYLSGILGLAAAAMAFNVGGRARAAAAVPSAA